MAAFQVIQANFPKVNLLSQYWQNGNAELTGYLLTLNCNILKTACGSRFKFGKNAY